MCDNTSVQVAVRVRPLVQSEISKGSRDLLDVHTDSQQIRIKDTDKAFTYNYVFDSNTKHEVFYNTCIKSMIENLFKGYNVTILAYGQTGSGKTYSMGTAYTGDEDLAVIPRALHDIFAYVKDSFSFDFTITVSFMELYQEVLYDLLSNKSRDQCVVEIREDNKGIIIPGITEQPVTSAKEALAFLMTGSSRRATGSTNMNAQSSRSHAIFTVSICMQKRDNSNLNKMAKFHLVDLAGSERSKKTGATGTTFKEGVNINKGLLSLGNVISALGDEKSQYISYRDSNLTRLLKDSLGGNSITLMIACVSPADYNLEETLSTLRYADRARKIKNKPIVNQDPKAAEINRLMKLVQQLRLELVGQGGPIICQAELELLKKEISDLKTKNNVLNLRLSASLTDNTVLFERVLLMQTANEELINKLRELKEEYNVTLNNLNLSIERSDVTAIKDNVTKLQSIQTCLNDINSEQIKNVEKIRHHEAHFVQNSSNTDDDNSEHEINERQECHTAQQIALNSELQDVTKKLAMKEHLAQQIAANTCYAIDYSALAENETRIASLQLEKEELVQQLKNLQAQGGSSKIAEQRKKRVQELETQIHDLNKKVVDQAKLIKLKEKDEQKVKKLNNEILSMKQMKVQLIKKMREESEKFRTWKLQRERDLHKLKDQDRKRQNQIVKMETMHSRQQNVLKRKVEEAAAINKRLKEALEKRKVAQELKGAGKIERVTQWIQHELEIHVNTIDAQATLKGLLEDRALLHKQLDVLKADEDMCQSLEVKQLEDDIELRSAQIQDLQQKVLDSSDESKAPNRWDNVQSMAEAKHALKVLFELVAEIRKKNFSGENKIHHMEEKNATLMKQINDLARDTKERELDHTNNQREYEEKISVLLHTLESRAIEGGEGENGVFKIQQGVIQDLNKENAELKKKIEEINSVASSSKTPRITLQKGKAKKKGNSTYMTVEPSEFFTDEEVELDDDAEADPDWRKTPLGKRIQKLKNSTAVNFAVDPDRLKRSSEGGCTCKGKCSTRTCGCRRTTKSCSTTCRCTDQVCTNRDISVEETSNKEDSDDSFKKPRLPLQAVGENIIDLRSKRKKRLFLTADDL